MKKLIKYCKQNDIGIYFSNAVFQVKCKGAVLYQSSDYADCLEYLSEMMIVDKYSNHWWNYRSSKRKGYNGRCVW